MTIQETQYADYLFNLATPSLVAQSYSNIQNNTLTCQEEIDYFNYLLPLTGQEIADADYNVFSHLHDIINVSLHNDYYAAFENVNYSMEKCKRQKEPNK